MRRLIVQLGLIALLLVILSGCKKEQSPTRNVLVIQGNGDIADKMNAFRHLLGDQLNTTTGVTGGRREIDWDGVPDSLMGKAMPLDFFNPVGPGSPQARQRGLTYVATGEFRVSNINFQDINNKAAGQFGAFSGNKTFANITSRAWEIVVEKAGQHIPATTRGFGVVFADVDLPNSTYLELFNGTRSLGKFFAPAHDASGKFSFLGIYFNSAERITKISIHHDGVLADGGNDISDNGPHDLVVLDDIMYSEPEAQHP